MRHSEATRMGSGDLGTGEDDRRRDELRKAGEDYLAQAMAQATKGKDPFKVDPDRVTKERRERKKKDDPEFVAFGILLKNARVYVYMGLFVLCQAVNFLMVKMSFAFMRTPAVITFLHMVTACGAIAAACKLGRSPAFEPLQLNMTGLKGSLVRIVLYSTQMLCTFSALHHNSLNIVLVWTTAFGAAIEAFVNHQLEGLALTKQSRTALMVSFAVGVLQLYFDYDKVAVGLLMLFLWSLSKAAECVWKHMKVDASLGGRIKDPVLISRIERQVDEEAQLGASTLAFMQNAIPAVPVLLLGFVCLEGEELVAHELTVPGLRIMLLAVTTFTGFSLCQLLLDEYLTLPSSKLAVKGAALIGAASLFAWEYAFMVTWLGWGLTVISVSASLLAVVRQRQAANSKSQAAAAAAEAEEP